MTHSPKEAVGSVGDLLPAVASSAQSDSSWFHALHHHFILGMSMLQRQYSRLGQPPQVYQIPCARRLRAVYCKCSIRALTGPSSAHSIERLEGMSCEVFFPAKARGGWPCGVVEREHTDLDGVSLLLGLRESSERQTGRSTATERGPRAIGLVGLR
jgi:hypothetical protein